MSILDHVSDDDVFDTRDLVDVLATLDEEDEDEAADAAAIRSLFEELSSYAGDRPEDGIGLIRDSYFVKYAQQLADDLGAIDSSAGWPLNCIDWEQAARELRMGYTSVEVDGITYYYR